MQNNTCETTGEDEYLHGGRVKYNALEKNWNCLDCGYTALQGNSKSVLLHRNKHVRDKRLQDEQAFDNERTSVGLDNTHMENRFLALDINPEQATHLDDWVKEYGENGGNNNANEIGNDLEPHDSPNGNPGPQNGEEREPHHYETLNFVSWDHVNEEWVCQVDGCGKKFSSNQGMSKHVSRMHTTLKTANREKCPYCPKYYTHLKDMLMHLTIIKNVIRKGGWATARCAHIPAGDSIHTKWQKLEQTNMGN